MGNLNISHIDRKFVSDTIVWIESIYSEMHGTRRKRHKYLGMWMDYSNRGEIKISIEGYLREILYDFPE